MPTVQLQKRSIVMLQSYPACSCWPQAALCCIMLPMVGQSDICPSSVQLGLMSYAFLQG